MFEEQRYLPEGLYFSAFCVDRHFTKFWPMKYKEKRRLLKGAHSPIFFYLMPGMWIIMVGAPAAIMDHEVTSKIESTH